MTQHKANTRPLPAGAEGIEGRVFLVTGSGSGLGAGLAKAAASHGARVIVNCRGDTQSAGEVAHQIHKNGGKAIVCSADVTDYEQAGRLVEEARRAFDHVDVLVNTVGRFLWHPVAELEPLEWRRMMASNLDSVYHMSRLVIPHMRGRHWGRILNLGAVGAERTQGQPRTSAYSAAKSAVIAFSKALALEEARYGITVNVISPGETLEAPPDTDRAAADHAALLGDRVPVGRSGGLDDVVRAMLFFTSPSAGFLTGQVLAVAGGWHL